jgi:hypothetical protein
MITICSDNQNNAVTFSGCASDGAARADAFIIGVGMKANKC